MVAITDTIPAAVIRFGFNEGGHLSVTIRRAERKIASVRPRLVHGTGDGWASQQAGAVAPEMGVSGRNLTDPVGIEE